MKKKRFRKEIVAAFIGVVAFACTGCQNKGIELNSEEQEIVVNYAANAVLKHDKNNIDRMQSVEIETQTEAQTTITLTGDNQTEGIVNETQATKNMNDVVTIDGVDIQCNSYEVVDSYPSNGSEIGMSMVAVKGYKLLVMKFNVSNVTDSDIAVNMLGVDTSYKAIINDSVKMNVQVTALLNALNTYSGVLTAHNTQEMVLVFQINENDADNISSVKLEAGYGGNSGTIVIN